MRVVQALGWYFPDSLGGSEVYVAALSRRLRAAGADVVVAAPDPTIARAREYAHDGIEVYRYPVPRSPTRAEAQGLVPARGVEQFHDWLRARRPDVVHVHSFVTGLGLRELKVARAAGARVIVTAHSGSLGFICQRGTMMRWGSELCDGISAPAKCAACALQDRGLGRPLARALGAIPPALGRVAHALSGRLGTALSMSDLITRNAATQREMLATVDRFVVLTDWALRAACANGGPRDRIALNRLGRSHEVVRPKANPDERPTTPPITVGYLGRFDRIKGAHDLARAVASLPQDVPLQVHFRGPASRESERACLAELRDLVGGRGRAHFGAPVATAEVPSVLAGFDALCCPALCLEGGPTVAIEAHAVGTPVVGTRIGGLAELVEDGVNGRLVPPGDWAALARVLGEMAAAPRATIDRWRRHLPRARTMDEVAADYQRLYGG